LRAGLFQRGARRAYLARERVALQAGLAHLGLGDAVLGEQRLVAREIGFRVRQRRPGRIEPGLGLCDGGGDLAVVDLHQQIARRDPIALGDGDGAEVTADPGGDLDAPVRDHVPGGFVLPRLHAGGDRQHRQPDRRFGCR
jgi:hypothetical protein